MNCVDILRFTTNIVISMKLTSQRMREKAPEIDPLRLACGWSEEDLEKPWVLIETVGGQSHPGSFHLKDLAEYAIKGVYEAQGAPARYDCTDMCDGIAQGTEGMNYSLASREVISFAVEFHFRGGQFDGAVLLSGCDKSLPGHLLAAARLDAPTVIIPGGVMDVGPGDMTLERVGTIYSDLMRGRIEKGEYEFLRKHACPSSGACAFMGTACTMQVLAEALGLGLPTSAVCPTQTFQIKRLANEAGKRILALIDEGLTPRKILTKKSIENAIMVHAAIGGSTNALLHLTALAKELEFKLPLDNFDELNREIPFICNVRPSGVHPSNHFYYAGGTQRVIKELMEYLHMDCLTVTGRTLEGNLKELERTHFFERNAAFLSNYAAKAEDVIRNSKKPISSTGAIAVLKGNIAPEGAVVKKSAVDPEMFRFKGRARVFNSQDSALRAIFEDDITKGDVIFIRYEGPRGNGMPEQFYVTEAIASDPELNKGVALVTDGRFSGASRGPCIAHASPEAAVGGPIAIVEDGDVISIDIDRRRLELIGIKGREIPRKAVEKMIAQRLERWRPPKPKYTSGMLAIYTSLASSASDGGLMRIEERRT